MSKNNRIIITFIIDKVVWSNDYSDSRTSKLIKILYYYKKKNKMIPATISIDNIQIISTHFIFTGSSDPAELNKYGFLFKNVEILNIKINYPRTEKAEKGKIKSTKLFKFLKESLSSKFDSGKVMEVYKKIYKSVKGEKQKITTSQISKFLSSEENKIFKDSLIYRTYLTNKVQNKVDKFKFKFSNYNFIFKFEKCADRLDKIMGLCNDCKLWHQYIDLFRNHDWSPLRKIDIIKFSNDFGIECGVDLEYKIQIMNLLGKQSNISVTIKQAKNHVELCNFSIDEKKFQKTLNFMNLEGSIILLTKNLKIISNNEAIISTSSIKGFILEPMMYKYYVGISDSIKTIFENYSNNVKSSIDVKDICDSKEKVLGNSQLEALSFILNSPYSQIVGEGGSGKTFLLKTVVSLFSKKFKYNVIILTNNLCTRNTLRSQFKDSKYENNRLCTGFGSDVRLYTIALVKTLYIKKPQKIKEYLSKVDCVIIDECQNVSLEGFYYSTLTKNAKFLINFGDPVQIRSVGKGMPYKEVNEYFKLRYELKENFRLNSEKTQNLRIFQKYLRNSNYFYFQRKWNKDYTHTSSSDLIRPDYNNGFHIFKSGGINSTISFIKKEIENLYNYYNCKIQEIAICTYTNSFSNILNEKLSFMSEMFKKQENMKVGENIERINNIIFSGSCVKFIKNYNSKKIKIGKKTVISDSVIKGEVKWILKIEKLRKSRKIYVVHFEDNKKILIGHHVKIKHIINGYCRTIDSTIGSGYDYCILILNGNDYLTLDNNRIYTASSRARKRFYIIGEINFETKKNYNLYGNLRNSCTIGEKIEYKDEVDVIDQIKTISNHVKKSPQCLLSKFLRSKNIKSLKRTNNSSLSEINWKK